MEQIKLIKRFDTEIKSIDKDAFTVDAIASSKKVDRDGDVITPEAFEKRLKSYKEHPVLLSSHDYSDLRKQIGEAVSVKITEDGLECKFKYYAGQGNEEADWAWNLAQKGVASYSIGFIGHEWEAIEDKETKLTIGRKFTEVELLEVSQVLVPSNPRARQKLIEDCVLVEKAFEIKEEVKKDLASEPKPVVEAEVPAPVVEVKEEIKEEVEHYSKEVLGAPDVNPKDAPKEIDFGQVVSDTVSKLFKK